MFRFFMSGGLAMVFVLLFGLLALAAAIRFALRPDARRLERVHALSRATLFAAATGIFASLSKVFSVVPELPEAKGAVLPLFLLEGASESFSNGVLGFALLAVTWIIAAAGHRRPES